MLRWKEVHVLDKNAEYWGIATDVLMENAGRGVAEFVAKLSPKRVLVICGPGNNGGDGYVAARYLMEKGFYVEIFAVKEPKTPLAKKNRDKLPNDIFLTELRLDGYDLLIDAMLGIGLKPPLKEPYRGIVEKINKEFRGTVVSVDVPTGLGTDIHIKPRYTITFHDIKEGMSRENSGEIIVVDIGIPKEAEVYTGPGEVLLYPIPNKDSHKGERGIVCVIGGGPYTGAPVLSAIAAYRSGCDLVHIVTSRKIYGIIASFSPSLIVHPSFEEFEDFDGNIPKCHSVLIGPGLGYSETKKERVLEFLRKCELPIVVDADALKALKNNLEVISGKEVVITPHRGEFKFITGLDASKENAEKIAKEYGITVLLKAPVDVITDGEKTKLNKTGNQAMSVGGTGDVLAGITAALLSKNLNPFDSARLAAYISGRAGDLAFKEKFYGLMPMDVIDKIPEVLKEVLWRD